MSVPPYVVNFICADEEQAKMVEGVALEYGFKPVRVQWCVQLATTAPPAFFEQLARQHHGLTLSMVLSELPELYLCKELCNRIDSLTQRSHHPANGRPANHLPPDCLPGR